MRGLKLWECIKEHTTQESHLLQMRGLKQEEMDYIKSKDKVASFTDAWIETIIVLMVYTFMKSHLLQMRGFKQICTAQMIMKEQSHLLQMRGLKRKPIKATATATSSHLLQMRGLKPPSLNRPNPA